MIRHSSRITCRMWVQRSFLKMHRDMLFVLYFLLEFTVTWMDKSAPVSKCWGVSVQT